MKGVVLTPARQMIFAAIALGLLTWVAISSIAILIGAITQSRSDQELAQMQARSERWVADREARLNSSVAQLNASGPSLGGLADSSEKRPAAPALGPYTHFALPNKRRGVEGGGRLRPVVGGWDRRPRAAAATAAGRGARGATPPPSNPLPTCR